MFVAFPGLRYNLSNCSLSDVIAPPYDVVDETERVLFSKRSPYNAIHVELPVPDDTSGLDRYASAASIFSDWQRDGILQRDGAPSFYIYRMRFLDELRTPHHTTGVIGALRIDEQSGKKVLPHEQTMPKPKGDRLDLLRACHANLSPIWGLSLSSGLTEACAQAMNPESPPMSATDDQGTIHELWPVSDQESLSAIGSLVDAGPVVIADGHHRYETARHYQHERRAVLGSGVGEHDFVMAYVVELSQDELFVEAIHRLVTGWAPEIDLLGKLQGFFEVLPFPSAGTDLGRAMVEHGALGCICARGNFLLVPRPNLDAQAEADLDSSRLDVFLASMPHCELTYQHGFENVRAAVATRRAQAGFLLRPATIQQIADTAYTGQPMPPKTTFFQPKPRTGIVYRSVRT